MEKFIKYPNIIMSNNPKLMANVIQEYLNSITRLEFERILESGDYLSDLKPINYFEIKDHQDVLLMEKANFTGYRSFYHTMAMFIHEHGRIPTPGEFYDVRMNDIAAEFKKHSVTMSAELIRAYEHRLKRTHRSLICELHLQLVYQELYPDHIVYISEDLDLKGVDMVVEHGQSGALLYLHICKNKNLKDILSKKEGRSNRSFRNETIFKYDAAESNSTKIINGYPLFKPLHVYNKTRFEFFKQRSNYQTLMDPENLIKKHAAYLIA